MTTDAELLRQFAATRSETAFTALVQRHVNLVYSAALRQMNGDEHLAKDVAQMVFSDLARKAGSLSRRETLTGWLYTSAHFAATKMVRGENRRRGREEKFMREPTSETAPELDWEKIRPTLDDAMHELKEADREAILLRYFENRQFAEVGAKLGLNENAARMRVERALEKLRGVFAKRGITTAAGFASVISANAIQIAPANLAATLTTASIVTEGTGTFTLLKIMTATKLKLAFSALVVAGAATTMLIQHQAQEKLRADNATMTQRLTQLRTDSENLSNRLAGIGDAKSLSDGQFNELLKLRGEVGVLRQKLSLQNPVTSQQSERKPNTDSSSNDLARQLAMAIANGDSTALGKLDELAKSQHEFFNTNNVGLTEEQREALSKQAFGPLWSAFSLLSEEAAQGNANALKAIGQAVQMDYLQGTAVNSLGDLAGQGNEGALEILLNPEKYGLLLSGVVGALKPAADNGNQKAIAALASIVNDQTQKPLWFMAADGLKKAAASGNQVATDALKSLPSNQ